MENVCQGYSFNRFIAVVLDRSSEVSQIHESRHDVLMFQKGILYCVYIKGSLHVQSPIGGLWASWKIVDKGPPLPLPRI